MNRLLFRPANLIAHFIPATAITLALLSAPAFAIGHIAGIDVYDRNEHRNLPVYWQHGKAWVEGRPGNEYQISIRNRAGQDVLAVVSVDGVNVVTGETANAQQGGYVIDAWQGLDVAGWRKSLSRTAAFYFTTLNDSYATRTGRPDNVGVIGVAMYRRKADPVYYAPPAVSLAPQSPGTGYRERADNSASAAPAPAQEKSVSGQLSDRIGTGYGRNESSPARYASFERASTHPEEVVTIYYDSRASLVARGVIRESPAPWREPQPFPGPFVADPPR